MVYIRPYTWMIINMLLVGIEFILIGWVITKIPEDLWLLTIPFYVAGSLVLLAFILLAITNIKYTWKIMRLVEKDDSSERLPPPR